MKNIVVCFLMIIAHSVGHARVEKTVAGSNASQERPRISSEMYSQLLAGEHNDSMIIKAVGAFRTTTYSLRVGQSHEMGQPTIENIPNGDIVQHRVSIPLTGLYEYTEPACIDVLLEEGIVYSVDYVEARPGCGIEIAQ